MKAIFITTNTKDTDSLVNAWNCWNSIKSDRIVFDYTRPPIDNARILNEVKKAKPDVIFYIGGAGLDNMPSIKTFIMLRNMAPLVNLCCDAGDEPWHQFIALYHQHECFDLQVTLDGCHQAPTDFTTVTPVDPTLFLGPDPIRDILCGFSGNYGRPAKLQPRGCVIQALRNEENFSIRRRNKAGDYEGHVAFTRRCNMVLNFAWRGSGIGYHVKGRVLEAARAGCSLLENEGTQTSEWLPEELFFTYSNIGEIKEIIHGTSIEELIRKGNVLRDYVKDRYHPREIYGSILKEIGLVVPTVKTATG